MGRGRSGVQQSMQEKKVAPATRPTVTANPSGQSALQQSMQEQKVRPPGNSPVVVRPPGNPPVVVRPPGNPPVVVRPTELQGFTPTQTTTTEDLLKNLPARGTQAYDFYLSKLSPLQRKNLIIAEENRGGNTGAGRGNMGEAAGEKGQTSGASATGQVKDPQQTIVVQRRRQEALDDNARKEANALAQRIKEGTATESDKASWASLQAGGWGASPDKLLDPGNALKNTVVVAPPRGTPPPGGVPNWRTAYSPAKPSKIVGANRVAGPAPSTWDPNQGLPQPINTGYQYQNRDFAPVNPQNQQMNPAQQQQMAQLQQQQSQPYQAANYSQYQAQPGSYIPVAIQGNSNPGQAQQLAQLQQQQGQAYAAPRGQAYDAAPADQQWVRQTNQNMAGVPLATAPKTKWGAPSSYYNAAMGGTPIDNTGYQSGGKILPTSRQEAEYPPQQPRPIYQSGGKILPTSRQEAEYPPQQPRPIYQSGGKILPTSRQEAEYPPQQPRPIYQSGGEILPTRPGYQSGGENLPTRPIYRSGGENLPTRPGYQSGGENLPTRPIYRSGGENLPTRPIYQSGGENLPTSRQEAVDQKMVDQDKFSQAINGRTASPMQQQIPQQLTQAQIQQWMAQQRNPPPMNGNYM